MIPTLTGGKAVEWTPLATFFDARSPVDQVPWGRWRYVQNFRIDDRYGWGPRSGFRRFGYGTANESVSDLNTWTGGVVTSLHAHPRQDGTRVLLAGSSTTVARYSADGRWTTIGTLAEGSRPVFTSVNDVVVVTNGTDRPKYWLTGDTELNDFEELDDIGLSQASVVGSWNGVLFFGDVVMDGTRVGHRVLWSDVNKPLALAPATDRVSGFQDLDSGAKVLAILPLADVLFIFTTRSIWRVSAVGGDEQYAFQRVHFAPDGDGCLLAPHAICEARGNAVYLASDGVYVFNPFGNVPERPEWIFRTSARIDLTECHEASLAYNPDFDEIRIAYVNTSGPREMLALNWAAQSADVIDHGATALLSTKEETYETFYEWLIRVAGCSIGTRTVTVSPTGVPDTYSGLAGLWPELRRLVTDIEYVGAPAPAPPPPPETTPEEEFAWEFVPYSSPTNCMILPFVYPGEIGSEEPDVGDIPNLAAIQADATVGADAYFASVGAVRDSGPTWVYSSAIRSGWYVNNRWRTGGHVAAGGYNSEGEFVVYDSDPCRLEQDEFSYGGWTLNFTGVKATPEIQIKYGDTVVGCAETTPSTDNGTNFGSTTAGTPVDVEFTVRSQGSATLTGISVTAPGGFTLVTAPSTSLASGAESNFTLRLNAATAGSYTGRVVVNSNAGECFFQVSGEVAAAVPEVSVEGNSIAILNGDTVPRTDDNTDFGETPVGTPVEKQFVVENVGSALLTLGAATVPAGFTATLKLPTSLAASASATLGVRLDATDPGIFSGNVAFVCNDPVNPTFTFAITGGVTAVEDTVCDQIPSGADCNPCQSRNVFLFASATDGCLKQEEPDIFYREIRSGTSYLQSSYAAIVRSGCLAFESRTVKRLQKISFDVIGTSGDSLIGYVYRSTVPAEPGTAGCTLKTTTLSAKKLQCPTPEARPRWSLILDAHHFTFEFRIASVTGPAWFSRLGAELGTAPVSTP